MGDEVVGGRRHMLFEANAVDACAIAMPMEGPEVLRSWEAALTAGVLYPVV